VDVSSNSCNIDNIVEREKKTNKEQTQKTTLKKDSQKTKTRDVYREECKINLTENDSWKMSS
jgi:hypothetical protein